MDESTRQDLESKITFLEHTVDALNDALLAQGAEIEKLHLRFELLEGRLKAANEAEDAQDPFEERPPHY